MYFPFFEEVPFPVKVCLTNVYEAASEKGGWVAQLQGTVFAVSSMKMVPLEEKCRWPCKVIIFKWACCRGVFQWKESCFLQFVPFLGCKQGTQVFSGSRLEEKDLTMGQAACSVQI